MCQRSTKGKLLIHAGIWQEKVFWRNLLFFQDWKLMQLLSTWANGHILVLLLTDLSTSFDTVVTVFLKCRLHLPSGVPHLPGCSPTFLAIPSQALPRHLPPLNVGAPRVRSCSSSHLSTLIPQGIKTLKKYQGFKCHLHTDDYKTYISKCYLFPELQICISGAYWESLLDV